MKDGQLFPYLFYLVYVFTMSLYCFYNVGGIGFFIEHSDLLEIHANKKKKGKTEYLINSDLDF